MMPGRFPGELIRAGKCFSEFGACEFEFDLHVSMQAELTPWGVVQGSVLYGKFEIRNWLLPSAREFAHARVNNLGPCIFQFSNSQLGTNCI